MARAKMEPLRSLAFGSISGSYATLGTPTANPVRLFCITNDTEGDMILSIDGINDHFFLKAGSFKLFDIQSNMSPEKESKFVFDEGTQFYVKQSTAPVSGAVYVEILYGLN
jgi:hypothetical protein